MSAESNLVIVHYLDGTVVKGTTQAFFPNRPRFHLVGADGTSVEVKCADLKAAFFVKDLQGNPTRQDARGFITSPGETVHGKKLAVRFKDGEIICGYSLSYVPGRDGFFMFPADTGSNNLRVYVVANAAAEICAGAAADKLAQKAVEGGRRHAA
jgi:hypothetical protein